MASHCKTPPGPQHGHPELEAVGLEAQQAAEEGLWVLVVLPAVRPRDSQDAFAAVGLLGLNLTKVQREVDHTSLALHLLHKTPLCRSGGGWFRYQGCGALCIFSGSKN